jgi:hypothetical protein
MKIRKLIFSAKLEQIEKQNQTIFIYHCSTNAAQWRFLKNFLFFSGRLAIDSNEYGNPSGSSGLSLFPIHQQNSHAINRWRDPGVDCELMYFRVLESNPLEAKVRDRAEKVILTEPSTLKSDDAKCFSSRRADCSVYGLRGYTFFQSTKIRANGFEASYQRFLVDNHSESSSFLPNSVYPGQSCGSSVGADPVSFLAPTNQMSAKNSRKRRSNLLLSVSAQAPNSSKSSNTKFRPKGCLFFFDIRSNTVFETHQKSLTALELVNKIESLDFNNNLILLSGQLKSTVVNHVDLKEAMILNTRATYQQFFLSMHWVSIDLSFSLHQKIDEFFFIHERKFT